MANFATKARRHEGSQRGQGRNQKTPQIRGRGEKILPEKQEVASNYSGIAAVGGG